MKNTTLTIALCFGLLACSLGVNADKTGYYRWSDNDGKQHFTQQPPRGYQYDFVETSSGATMYSSGSDGVSIVANSDPKSAIDNEERKSEKMEIFAAPDPALCEKASANIKSLRANGARIRITNADGSTRMLNTEEIKQQQNRAKQVMKLNCH